MNQDQLDLLNFFLNRTFDSKRGQAEILLLQVFSTQENRPLTQHRIDDIESKLLPLVKPEYFEAVKERLDHFPNRNEPLTME